MPRKIIQIAARGAGRSSSYYWEPAIYALCNDGTAWVKTPSSSNWVGLPSIPQEPKPDTIFKRFRRQLKRSLQWVQHAIR